MSKDQRMKKNKDRQKPIGQTMTPSRTFWEDNDSYIRGEYNDIVFHLKGVFVVEAKEIR